MILLPIVIITIINDYKIKNFHLSILKKVTAALPLSFQNIFTVLDFHFHKSKLFDEKT